MEKTSLSELYSYFLNNKNISTDSRDISPGCIFFALKGDRFNGNLFARDALEKGAAWAVTDEPQPYQDSRVLLVDDVLSTLQQLAMMHRKQNPVPLIAITGTNGKTTTKEITAAVLSKKFKIICTQGNLNNHIGVPRTILDITPETQIAVVEMGANHVGEIKDLCKIALPDFGIITNAGRAHLEGFGSFEGVIRAKSELYHHIHDHRGMVFVNADDPLLMKASDGINRKTYGTSDHSDIQATPLNDGTFTGLTLNLNNKPYTIQSNLFGNYNFTNILAAVSVGLHFGIPPEEISNAIGAYYPSNNRSQLKKTERNTLILDAYNANPASMAAALKNLASTNRDNVMLILGDMLELGSDSKAEHEKIIELIGELKFSNVILVGPVFTDVYKGTLFKTFFTSGEALEYLRREAPSGHLILIKGSRGIKMELVIETL